jgi:microcystin-dependent protein
MADPFVAEIRIFGFNFAPKGWAFCNGQLLPISQNTALFSLLGTFYGGDGKSTFALPGLQGSAALGAGQSPGGSDYVLGQIGGAENVTLLQSEMPMHTHTLGAFQTVAGDQFGPNPNGQSLLAQSKNGNVYSATISNFVQMAPQALPPAGGSLPHSNMQSSLVLNFCIAMQGVFPARG